MEQNVVYVGRTVDKIYILMIKVRPYQGSKL